MTEMLFPKIRRPKKVVNSTKNTKGAKCQEQDFKYISFKPLGPGSEEPKSPKAHGPWAYRLWATMGCKENKIQKQLLKLLQEGKQTRSFWFQLADLYGGPHFFASRL